MAQIQFHGLAIRKNLRQFLFDCRALPKPPEIIDMEKPSAKEVLPQAFRLLIGEVHAAGLDDIKIRISVEFRIQSGDDMRSFVKDADTGQALHTPHELAVGCRKIRRPTSAIAGAALACGEIGASNVKVWSSRGTIAVSVDEACKEKLRRRVGPGVGKTRYDKKHGGQNRPECQ